jgi:hypothetical protein
VENLDRHAISVPMRRDVHGRHTADIQQAVDVPLPCEDLTNSLTGLLGQRLPRQTHNLPRTAGRVNRARTPSSGSGRPHYYFAGPSGYPQNGVVAHTPFVQRRPSHSLESMQGAPLAFRVTHIWLDESHTVPKLHAPFTHAEPSAPLGAHTPLAVEPEGTVTLQ